MGLWTERVVPRITNRFLDNAHVRAVRERKGVRVWQARVDPINRRIVGGCHLDRPIDTLLTGAGFVLERLDNSYAKGDPKPFGCLYEGVARG